MDLLMMTVMGGRQRSLAESPVHLRPAHHEMHNGWREPAAAGLQ
jgi:hypothetical protein